MRGCVGEASSSMDTAHSQRTKSTDEQREDVEKEQRKAALHRRTDSRRSKIDNVPVLGAIRVTQYVARLTYCITIQSGRTGEYPKAEKNVNIII